VAPTKTYNHRTALFAAMQQGVAENDSFATALVRTY
jgi:hypothetical protein